MDSRYLVVFFALSLLSSRFNTSIVEGAIERTNGGRRNMLISTKSWHPPKCTTVIPCSSDAGRLTSPLNTTRLQLIFRLGSTRMAARWPGNSAGEMVKFRLLHNGDARDSCALGSQTGLRFLVTSAFTQRPIPSSQNKRPPLSASCSISADPRIWELP